MIADLDGESRPTLLSLPSELRLRIFEFLFADIEAIFVGRPSDLPWEGRPKPVHPAVTAVSRQLQDEALPILYRNKPVVLLLRYREGRAQVQQWLKKFATDPALCKHMRSVSIQYFETAHRSTAVQIDVSGRRVLNVHSWVHPLTGRPLQLFEDVNAILACPGDDASSGDARVSQLLSEIVEVMAWRVRNTRLSQCESMASLRLHGHTDFQLRFEVISVMYDVRWR